MAAAKHGVDMKIVNMTMTEGFGFGCVGLTALDRRESALRLLEEVFASGLTHFDISRTYGMGVAEEILGEFVGDRRAEISICTKFGINPPRIAQRVPFLSGIKRALKKMPFLDRTVRKAASSAHTMGNFSREAAEISLKASLRALRTDYLDVWLLHEANLEDCRNEDLIRFLLDVKKQGVVRRLGVGSAFSKISSSELIPPELEVLQFENNILRPNLSRLSVQDRLIITHSALSIRADCREVLHNNPRAVVEFREMHGLDLTDPKILCGLLLAWAKSKNRNGIVLFGSTNVDHVRSNIVTATCDEIESKVHALESLFERLVPRST